MTRANAPRTALAAARSAVLGVAVAASAGLLAAGLGFAAQHPPTSLFTSLDLDACKTVKPAPAQAGGRQPGRAWQCEALLPVYVAEREGRFFISVGANGQKHKASEQTLGTANSPLDHKTKRIIVEWRVKTRAAGPQPYASIVRYFTTANGKPGEVLVITKIGNAQSCHVGYVDAAANPDAIVMARTAADEKAAAFDCATGAPAWIGAHKG